MMQKEIESYGEPQNYTPNNVCYWEETSKALMVAKQQGDRHASPLLTKAKMFILAGCIEQRSETEWICKPKKDYNKASHTIRSTEDGMECSCQGFNVKKKRFEMGETEITPICSHIVAVKQFCFLEAKK